jgi:hypothetical protein
LDEWNLYSAVLDVIPFSQRHTSENIACEVGFRLLDLKDSLLYCGTTDTAANFIRAMNLVLNNTWTSTINVDEMVEMDDFEETGFPCQDYLLDLVIKSAFDLSLVVNMDIAMVRDVVVTI